MENRQPFSTLATIMRILLGLFLIYFAGQKALDLDSFRETIEAYQIIYSPFDRYFAVLIVSLELSLGVLLILGGWGYQAAIVISALLFIIFIIGISSLWARGININCGCFGNSDEPTNYPLHILFNLGLIAGCAFLLWQSLSGKRRLDFNELSPKQQHKASS